jgi:hypothetical protein
MRNDFFGTVVGHLGLSSDTASTLRSRDWVLTEFEDHSARRPGTDEVYFRRDEDQSRIERPPVWHDQIEYVDAASGSTPDAAGSIGERFVLAIGVAALALVLVLGAVDYALGLWRARRAG